MSAIEQELFSHVLEEVLLSPALEHAVGDFDVAQFPSTGDHLRLMAAVAQARHLPNLVVSWALSPETRVELIMIKGQRIKPWLKIAIEQEDAKPPDRPWKGESAKDQIVKEQRKSIRFLWKQGKADPTARGVAGKLDLSPKAKMPIRRLSTVRTVVAAVVREGKNGLLRNIWRRKRRRTDRNQHRSTKFDYCSWPDPLVVHRQFSSTNKIRTWEGRHKS